MHKHVAGFEQGGDSGLCKVEKEVIGVLKTHMCYSLFVWPFHNLSPSQTYPKFILFFFSLRLPLPSLSLSLSL